MTQEQAGQSVVRRPRRSKSERERQATLNELRKIEKRLEAIEGMLDAIMRVQGLKGRRAR